ncbi:ASB18 protein, partial [Ciconia maguari]|nr:ASB18 protein [Ciconia maguari]
MGELPGPVTEKLQISPKLDSEHPLTAHAPATKYYTALVTGDLRSLEVLTDRYYQDVNLVFEISKNELEWQVKSQASYGLSGLWSLEYKRELTTPLCLAARRGHAACLRHLLRRRGHPNLLHSSAHANPVHKGCRCRSGHPLLLKSQPQGHNEGMSGINPAINHRQTERWSLRCHEKQPSKGRESLAQAAGRGEKPNRRFFLKKTEGLSLIRTGRAAQGGICGSCTVKDSDCLTSSYQILGEVMLQVQKDSSRFPLHKACGAANAGLARFLLRRGADVNAIDYDGVSPLGCALQSAAFKRELRPHLAVQLLLNHGSQKIWPPAFVKVLKSCAAVPEIIEVLLNSYSQIPISEKWAEAVPEEVFQQHQLFYESFFRLAGTVRCLQHLCRSAIRKKFGSKCHCLIPLLPVPKPLHDYLLLEPEGVVL